MNHKFANRLLQKKRILIPVIAAGLFIATWILYHHGQIITWHSSTGLHATSALNNGTGDHQISEVERREFKVRLDELRSHSFTSLMQMIGNRLNARKDFGDLVARPEFTAFVENFYALSANQQQQFLSNFAMASQTMIASDPKQVPGPVEFQKDLARAADENRPEEMAQIQQFFHDLGRKRSELGFTGGPW